MAKLCRPNGTSHPTTNKSNDFSSKNGRNSTKIRTKYRARDVTSTIQTRKIHCANIPRLRLRTILNSHSQYHYKRGNGSGSDDQRRAFPNLNRGPRFFINGLPLSFVFAMGLVAGACFCRNSKWWKQRKQRKIMEEKERKMAELGNVGTELGNV